MNTITYEFRKSGWPHSDFLPAYSPACRAYPEFTQEEDCIANRRDAYGKYEYISMVTGKEYEPGAVFTTSCSFESYGAPLIVLADGLERGADGITRYKSHFEVVAYEGGVNVWRIVPEGNGVRPENLTRRKFPVPAGGIVRLSVETERDGITVSLGKTRFRLPVRLPERFRAGITACEGIDRFYDFTVWERTEEK